MTPRDDPAVTDEDLTVDGVDSAEYEYAVVASATLDGPRGPVVVERRYEGLPRHNDELDRDAVDSNDDLVDRPDAVHVHTRFYAAGRERYLGDEHASWRPEDPSMLSDADAFREACRAHFLDALPATYENAPTE